MEAHPDSGLYQTAEALGAVDGRTAFQAALAGDETALAVCRQYVAYLANGATSLINILRPEAVAIGGGVAAAPARAAGSPGCCGRNWATTPASSARPYCKGLCDLWPRRPSGRRDLFSALGRGGRGLWTGALDLTRKWRTICRI